MIDVPVLIAGAGVAGLTAAVALSRAGVPVLLAERRTGFSEVGAGLQLSPNATSALKLLGLGPGVARFATAPARLDIRRWTDPRAYAGMPMNEGGGHDAPFWALRRADLQTALLDEARMSANLKLLVGRTVTAIAETPEAVTVTLQSDRGATETVRAGLLIGADGVRSQVRSLIGDRKPLEFLGYEAWRTLIPIAAAPTFMRKPAVNLWLGQNHHAVHYPVANGAQINLVLIRAGQLPWQDWDHDAAPGDIAPLIEAAAEPLRDLMQAAPAWRRWSLFDRKGAGMGRGRVALAGDAAHPVLPFMAQGAGLAIEDAAVLARLIPPALADRSADAVSRAVAAYGAERRARAEQVQALGRRNVAAYHAGFPVSTVRDFIMGRMGETGLARRHAWIYGWRAAS
jgi:salicylate hydroxylase